MNTFVNTLSETNEYKRTENGATAHNSTHFAVYDMFAFGGAYRKRSDADIARAIGTVSDILSMGSAYFGGYGTVASAVLGLTGTASNLYGDIRDPNVSA